jgi:hypothetical protein
MSAVPSYTDTDSDACTSNSLGVHTCNTPADPSPPSSTPNRPDVFMAGRQFPMPATDFSAITQNLADIKAQAQTSGVYASSSGVFGYDLAFATSGMYSLYKVTALTSAPGGCTNVASQTNWGTWSIQSETLKATGTIPNNGSIFLEDNVWVRGQIDTKRVTVAAATLPDNPASRKSITVNKNLLYTNYDGRDVISLVAQNNLNVGLVSSDTLEIDGAVIAQNGRAGRYYYSSSSCSPYGVRTKLILNGMIASSQRYGFAYTDNTGYQTRQIIYDSNLLYGPPPNFPLVGTDYTQISWEEVQ